MLYTNDQIPLNSYSFFTGMLIENTVRKKNEYSNKEIKTNLAASISVSNRPKYTYLRNRNSKKRKGLKLEIKRDPKRIKPQIIKITFCLKIGPF